MPYLDIDSAVAIAAPVITDGAPLAAFGHSLLQLRTEVTRSLGNRSDVTGPEVDTWINDAYLLIASSIKLKETKGAFKFTLQSGKYIYLLPPQVQYTTRASLVDATNFPFDGGAPLDKIDEDTFRRLPNLTDVPDSYFVFGNMLVVHPAGTAQDVVVEYRLRPKKMVADADCPIFPEEWHRGILLKAKTFAYADLEEWDNRDRAQNDYVSFVREIGDPESEEKSGQYASFRRVNRQRQIRRYDSRLDPREEF